MVASGFFLFDGHVTIHQAISGTLVPSLGLLTISTPAAGTVTQSFVKDGDKVTRGQHLATISGDITSSSLGLMGALVIQSLASQKDLLNQNISDQKHLVAAQTGGLQSKIALLSAQLQQIDAQIAIQTQEVSVTQHLLSRFQTVGANGFVSGVQMQQQQSTVYQAQSQAKALAVQHGQIAAQLADAHDQLRQLPINAATALNETESKLADISQALAKSAANQSFDSTAPQSGVVSAMATEVGQTVAAGQAILSVMPAGARLQAQFLVPSDTIGFLRPGRRVDLRFDAFPYQEFGQPHGTVVSVSSSALTPAEVAGLSEQRTDDPLYRVVVALDRQSIDLYGQPEPLSAGLKLQASISLDRRRLIDWVFEPIIAAGHEFFSPERVP